MRDRGRFDLPPSASRPRVALGIVPGGDPKPGNSAPFPSRPSRKPSYPSQYGAKFDRRAHASWFPSAESPQIVIAVARQDGGFGIGWGPSYPEGDKSRPSASWEPLPFPPRYGRRAPGTAVPASKLPTRLLDPESCARLKPSSQAAFFDLSSIQYFTNGHAKPVAIGWR